ncbi:hypothetical protein CFIMG_003777RA, partial [Ceratocystis fimbriata CBS 114723]
MALPVIFKVTLQATIINVCSNLIAQGLTAFQAGLVINFYTATINWVSVFQFAVFAVLNTPPNFLWQTWLEEMFPSNHPLPTPTRKSKSLSNASATSPKPRLNVRHTVIKFLLDQTIGAAVNTLLFSLVMGALKASMTPLANELPIVTDTSSIAFLLSNRAVDAARVDWPALYATALADFWPIIVAGWRLWPAVSAVNYTLVKSVE